MKTLFAAGAATLSLALATPVLAATPQPAHQAGVPLQLPHVSVTVEGAKGSPVILIPGMATPRAVWDGIAPQLARRHRVYRVQVNGFGGDDPRANLGQGVLDGVVADLADLIRHRKLQGAAVIGHSMGGLVALKLALAHPSAAGKVMVVDALPFFGVLMAPPGSAPSVAGVEPMAAKMRDGILASYGKPRDPAMAAAQTRGMALRPEVQPQLLAWGAKADPRVVGQAMYEDITTDLRPALGKVAAPVTLVYPWNQASYPRDATAAFYKAQYAGLTQLTAVEVADAAHFVMLDQPERFAGLVTAFLGD